MQSNMMLSLKCLRCNQLYTLQLLFAFSTLHFTFYKTYLKNKYDSEMPRYLATSDSRLDVTVYFVSWENQWFPVMLRVETQKCRLAKLFPNISVILMYSTPCELVIGGDNALSATRQHDHVTRNGLAGVCDWLR